VRKTGENKNQELHRKENLNKRVKNKINAERNDETYKKRGRKWNREGKIK